MSAPEVTVPLPPEEVVRRFYEFLAKGQLVGVYYAKMEETEVAHGTGGGADIERIAWADEDDAQAIGFDVERQGTRVYSRSKVTK